MSTTVHTEHTVHTVHTENTTCTQDGESGSVRHWALRRWLGGGGVSHNDGVGTNLRHGLRDRRSKGRVRIWPCLIVGRQGRQEYVVHRAVVGVEA